MDLHRTMGYGNKEDLPPVNSQPREKMKKKLNNNVRLGWSMHGCCKEHRHWGTSLGTDKGRCRRMMMGSQWSHPYLLFNFHHSSKACAFHSFPVPHHCPDTQNFCNWAWAIQASMKSYDTFGQGRSGPSIFESLFNENCGWYINLSLKCMLVWIFRSKCDKSYFSILLILGI